MWPFRKTITFARSGILKGMTDCHSHLLPGVDDGVGTLDESLRILDMMEKHGVRKVWLTPHIMEDIPNETVTLQEKFQELKRSYNGTLELALAAEYMMDNLFEERLEKDDLLPLEEGKRYLLVETSYSIHQWNCSLSCNASKRKVITRCLHIRNGMNICRRGIIRP